MIWLSYDNLKREFAGRTVLDLDKGMLAGGQIYGIIGPNGAGKSTWLNIIAGLDRPSSGQMLYGLPKPNAGESQQALGAPPVFTAEIPRQLVTMIFQQPYLIHGSVERNVALPLRIRHWPRAAVQERVTGLLAELGISALARQRAGMLSGGEAQKVAFARALAASPQLLLLDEPTSNIDNAATADLERLLRKVNSEQGTTILLVSHDLSQIKRLTDQVIFMFQGRIIEQGQTSVVLKHPQVELTASYLQGNLLL